MRWNNIECIKPIEIGFYLCFLVEVNDLGISRYQDLIFWNEESFEKNSVTHWMKLPEQPKNDRPRTRCF